MEMNYEWNKISQEGAFKKSMEETVEELNRFCELKGGRNQWKKQAESVK